MTRPEILDGSGEGPAPIVPPAALPDSTGEQDVLGLRISAALVDLALLAGLFVIMASVAGQLSAGGGSFGVWLDWAWSAAFAAVAGLYYFVLEALFGQTVGKRLLGVQVYGPGGTRPSAWAVAVRTLLRIVDWLPLLYLAGFVTMMASGARRQRIGDLAARTAVARALPVWSRPNEAGTETAAGSTGVAPFPADVAAVPVRHQGLMVVPLAVVLLAAITLAVYRATSAGGTQTYRGHGVSFGYPAGWREESGYTGTSRGGAEKLWTTAVGPGTPRDLILVDAYRVSPAVTAQNIGAITPDLESSIRQLFTIQGGPEKLTMAGMPGLRFHATSTAEGARFHSTLVFAFNGTIEYFVNCQYTAGMAAQMGRACDQVTGSFHMSAAASGAAAPGTSPPSPAATSTTTPSSAASTTPRSSPINGTPGTGRLDTKVVPAPPGFTLSQSSDVPNGPMSAADFNRYWGDAASSHFARGYNVTYDATDASASIYVTVFQFATPADAAAFKADYEPGVPVKSKADPLIPGADDYHSTSPDQGTYTHGVIAAKGNRAFVIEDITFSAGPVPLVETMARQQYAAL